MTRSVLFTPSAALLLRRDALLWLLLLLFFALLARFHLPCWTLSCVPRLVGPRVRVLRRYPLKRTKK